MYEYRKKISAYDYFSSTITSVLPTIMTVQHYQTRAKEAFVAVATACCCYQQQLL